MAVKRKNIETVDSTATTTTTTTTTNTSDSETENESNLPKKINKNEINSKNKIDDGCKQEIFKILTNENVKKLTQKQIREEWIPEIANQLLNNVVMYIGGKEHMLVEIEFYFKGYNHVDEFTHADSMQLERGTWYFHRTNGAGYKGGSFKGMDITFGCGNGDGADEADDKGAYGGILIRSIQICSDQSIIDGPSLCVDHILKLTNSKDIASFVKDQGRSIFQSENSQLYLKLRDQVESDSNTKVKLPPKVEPNNLLSCARVGLTFKRYKKGQEYYIGAPYRYLRLPDKVKKGKHYMTTQLALSGKDNQSIKSIVGSTAAAIEKIKSQIKIGQSKTSDNIKDYKGELSTDDIVQLLSLCNKLLIEKESNDGNDNNDLVDNDNQAGDEENEENEETDE